MSKTPFPDDLLSAYLDGQASDDERREVEQALTESSEHRDLLAELRALREGLQALPRYKLDEAFAQRVLRLAERRMLEEGPNGEEGQLPEKLSAIRMAGAAVTRREVKETLAERVRYAADSHTALLNGGGWRRLVAAGLVLAASVLVMVVSTGDRDPASPASVSRRDRGGERRLEERGEGVANFGRKAFENAPVIAAMPNGKGVEPENKGDVLPPREPDGQASSLSLGFEKLAGAKLDGEKHNRENRTTFKEFAPQPQTEAPTAAPPSPSDLARPEGLESLDAPGQVQGVELEKHSGEAARQASRDHLDRLVERTTPGVLVVHVDVTEAAWRDGRFREVLEQHRIAWNADAADDGIRLDENGVATGEKAAYDAAEGKLAQAKDASPLAATEAVYVEAPRGEIAAVLAELDADARDKNRSNFYGLAITPTTEADAYQALARYYENGSVANLQSLRKNLADREASDAEVETLVRQFAFTETARDNISGGGKSGASKTSEESSGAPNGADALRTEGGLDAGALAEHAKREDHLRGRAVRLNPPAYGVPSAPGGFGGGGLGGGAPDVARSGGLGGAAAAGPGGGAAPVAGDTREIAPGGPSATTDFSSAALGEERIGVWFFFHVREAAKK